MNNKALEKLKRSGDIETLLPDIAQYTNRFEVKSESSNRLYVVAQNKNTGEWSCSCPGWVIARNGIRKCKHLTSLMPLLQAVPFKVQKQISAPKIINTKSASTKTKVKEEKEVDVEFDEHDPFLTDKKSLLAKKLDGREYRDEMTSAEEKQAKKDGLVIVYGASDDNMEFRGAIDDEIGCYDGGDALVDSEGLLPDRDNIDNDDELEKYFNRKRKAENITAVWCPKKPAGCSWIYKTKIPHATFKIMEDKDIYCVGIVFNINDLK